MSQEYFACFACHVRGSETPSGPPEQWAPNLAYAHQRLNPHWILGWIKNPQALMPGTKMPAFYEEGQTGPEDVLGGNTDAQIAAMRDYIMSIGARAGVQSAAAKGHGTTVPEAAPAAAPAAVPAPSMDQKKPTEAKAPAGEKTARVGAAAPIPAHGRG